MVAFTSGRDALMTVGAHIATTLDRIAGMQSFDRSDPSVSEFADQFSFDVASLDESQRNAFLGATGADAFGLVQRMYAADFVPRVQQMLDVFFGVSQWPVPEAYSGDTWALLDQFMVEVADLKGLDPTLTELVRLRGARLHDCELCRSRRSQEALDAGAEMDLLNAVDAGSSEGLDVRAVVALDLADSLVLRVPLESASVEAMRVQLRDEEIVEIILDVMRNAANKIAVALGADTAEVTDGVELF